MSPQRIKTGFIAAALMNIGGVLLFSKAFNNPTINEFDPVVMSNFGLLMIIVWGLAYLATAFVTTGVKWLAGAFAIEKLVYVLVWVFWIQDHSLASVYQQDLLAGVFYSIYGLNDLIFMLFFALVFINADPSRQRK